jgi:hypothetical protein
LRLVILMKTGAVVIPVETGIQGRALDTGVRRRDE